ncbi:ABC transporter permease [Pseudofrankia inefficax]|uniref:ABC-2 type transporter n=1 Tax=Pseudofrankia inefficax (strain DSM 45817 / CECT 9037 / DDB 130130 / EuI1c) TaxID=298654 RepID=E3J7X4_PSEI1|nr:ABC transporter permease subunit [Pseudofrankia inefficax]ADP82022.1 ABC-2 type transporter [Pseudofrankia inefficax]
MKTDVDGEPSSVTPHERTASGQSSASAPGPRGWRVVAEQEFIDLWATGRGPVLVFAFSVLLSVITYLAGTNQALNFLEQREAVNLTLQLAVAVGTLVTMVVSADAISGERERGTLENLLLAPVSRRTVAVGKFLAALSLWLASCVVSIPYIWVLGRGSSIVWRALLLDLAVGTLLAAALAALALLVSALSQSNKVSLSVSLFLLLSLFAPTQLPAGATRGWFGTYLDRLNPIAAGTHYMTALLVNGHGWARDLSYLASPLVTIVLAGGALLVAGPRIISLHAGTSRG